MIDNNEQLTMEELLQKYDITRQHLGRVIRSNNSLNKC